jgi:hypothetical protein
MNPMEIMGMMNQLKANPMALLTKKFNLPPQIPQNPQEIVQYLLNSGQISQEQVNQAMKMKKMFMK